METKLKRKYISEKLDRLSKLAEMLSNIQRKDKWADYYQEYTSLKEELIREYIGEQ